MKQQTTEQIIAAIKAVDEDDRFKKTRLNIGLCEAQMDVAGLLEEGYTFKMIHPESEFYYTGGLADNYRNIIALPQHLLIEGNPTELLNILNHQIAHAKIKLDNEMHGKNWKQEHKRLGGDGSPYLKEGENSTFTKHFRVSCRNSCHDAVEMSTLYEEYCEESCDVCGEKILVELINIETT